MLKIRAIHINVHTNIGLFGNRIEFSDGLNIIRGNNTSGKSTVFQCIVYALGMEEILGGKGNKVLQSVIKDEIDYDKGKIKVVESEVLLEIENKEIITIRRSIRSDAKDTKLVDVIEGAFLTDFRNSYNSKQMYLHDKGASQNKEFGFHAFLESFIGWELPEVNYVDGDNRKLYMQSIFSSFIIEQKAGWSDFLATIPYYGLRNSESRVIEFLLKLDTWNIEKKRQELNLLKQDTIARWSLQYEILNSLAKRGAAKVKGLMSYPEAINPDNIINLLIPEEKGDITIESYIEELSDQVTSASLLPIGNVGSNSQKNDIKIDKLNEDVALRSLQIEQLYTEIQENKGRLLEYENQLKQIRDDLQKNKAIAKIERFGGELGLQISSNNCPTCNQDIKDTLLDQTIDIMPMSIDENIKFLQAQEQMIKAYIHGLMNLMNEMNEDIDKRKNLLAFRRSEIRALRQELISDNRLPSIMDIESRLKMKNKLEFYEKLRVEFQEIIFKFEELAETWVDILGKLKDIPKDTLSVNDKRKLTSLEKEFKKNLRDLGYSSKSIEEIRISLENKYLPVIENYNIRFDSSASDLIRSIWAYTCALYKVSSDNNGNHPNLIMLDEPAQHSMSDESLHRLLVLLSSLKAQSIVAASFNNEDEVFNTTTKDIVFNLIHFKDRSISKLE